MKKERHMSWFTIKSPKGLWKIKPRWQMRWAEKHRQVRVIDLGFVVVSWWSHEDLHKL